VNKGIVAFGVVILLAGIYAAVGTATTVSVPDPTCSYQQFLGGWICDDAPQPNGHVQIFRTVPYVSETVYPYSIVGGIVALIGFVAAVIGLAIESRE
jgi:hypothetical protein